MSHQSTDSRIPMPERLFAHTDSHRASRSNRRTRIRPMLGLCLGLLMLGSARQALAFGGAGGLGECATFTTCTASAGTSTNAFVQYTFTSIFGSYALPVSLVPGANNFQDVQNRETTAAVRASVGDFCVNCATDNPFFSSAVARGQSAFAVNRGSAYTSVGAAGTDIRTFGTDVLGSAHVQTLTVADADSAWRDVWSFNADGHFNATIALDGHSATSTTNAFFPDTYTYVTGGTLGEWFYDLDVWDVTNLSVSEDFELGGPTLVARLRDRTGSGDEQRPSFASSLALDFDFLSGVSYVITAELGVHARNGRDIDLYNTARLTDVVLSNGATLNALSGHDYFAGTAQPVPEPGTTSLLVAGLACLGLWSRRRLRPGL